MNVMQLVRLINAEHGTSFTAGTPFEIGESRTAYRLHDQSGGWVLKYHDDPGRSRLREEQALSSATQRLRSAGYPAPDYRLVGHTAGTTYTIQEQLAGSPLITVLGDPTDDRQLAAMLPQLLDLNELQAGLGQDRASTWPRLIVETVLLGGREWCVHETMRQHSPATAQLLDRLQELVLAHRDGPFETRDLVHGDFQYANILTEDGRITGVVDWSFSEPGERAFDMTTLLFYSYDIPEVRRQLWDHVLSLAGPGAVAVYLAHLVLRQTEWSIRHEHPPSVISRYLRIGQDVIEDLTHERGTGTR